MKPWTKTLRSSALGGVVLALVGTVGCARNASAPAARYAVAEEAVASALVPLAELPHRLCIRTAQYTYLWQVVQPNAPELAPSQPWSDWYTQTGAAEDIANAGRLVTWKRDCADAEQAGQTIRKVLRALRIHAHALAALAASKKFNTTGLDNIASGAASVATTAGAPAGVGSSVTDAGAAVASFTAKFVQWYRQGKLDEAVEASDACMARVATDLKSMLDAVSGELEVTRRQRRAVVGMLRDTKWQPASSAGHLLVGSFELALDVDTEFEREAGSLARYADAVQRLADAHHLVAQRARSQAASKDVDAALDRLDATIDDMVDEQWDR